MTLKTIIERDIAGRMIFGFLLSTVFVLGLFHSHSLAHALLTEPGGVGRWIVIASGVDAALIAMDTYINDIAGDHLRLPWTSRHRYLLFNAGALMFIVPVYFAMREPGLLGETLAYCYSYAGFAVIGVILAWRDILRRPGYALWGV